MYIRIYKYMWGVPGRCVSGLVSVSGLDWSESTSFGSMPEIATKLKTKSAEATYAGTACELRQ